MKLVMEVEYLVCDSKSGIFKYRRRVPDRLRPTVGKREIIFSLKTKDRSTALRLYPAYHRKAEELLGHEDRKSTEQITYEATIRDLKQAGLIQDGISRLPKVDTEDTERSLAFRDAILSVADSMTDGQRQVRPFAKNEKIDRMVKAMIEGVEPPKVRLAQAAEFYLRQKRAKANRADLEKQVKIACGNLVEATGEPDPILQDMKLATARAFRDRLLDQGKSPATVRRRITTVKAIFNCAIKEELIEVVRNPFVGLDIPGMEDRDARELRASLTLDEIKACAPFIAAKNEDVRDLWVLQLFTGARPREISGLDWSEVHLDHPTPHFSIRWTEGRRIKSATSARKVPLAGEALSIMRRRHAHASRAKQVFPRYSTKRGADAVSTLQIEAMKQAGIWTKTEKVPYSLRHSMKDWMIRVAGFDWANWLQGHKAGGVPANYGSDPFLDIMQDHLTNALKTAGVWDYRWFEKGDPLSS